MCELRHTSAVVQKMQGDLELAWLARLAAMPEVLPVQFMQMLCSNGVKLRFDFAVAINPAAITNSAVPTIHNRKSPRRQFIFGRPTEQTFRQLSTGQGEYRRRAK